MKIQTNIIVKVLGIFFLLTTFIFAQTDTPSIDPEREVIVMFRSDAVIPPASRTEGQPDEFQIPDEGLRQLLLNTNVERIARLMPDFRPEDRFAISRTGETVQLTDWTHVYILRLPQAAAREAFLDALENRPEVVFAEINGRGEPDLVPNDEHFDRQWALKNDGTPLQGSGTAGADINATQAWEITTGLSSIKVGIVDNGMQTNHPDFTGRVTGDSGDNNFHGTRVAGVAAAQGNNTIGIAGVAWSVGIINEDYGAGSDADYAAAVRSAANRGADVINNSWKLTPVGRYSTAVRLAFADVYKLNRAAVASMGNQFETMGENAVQYPAAFGQGIITVGATTNTDVRAVYSSTGNWIDVVAPGGAGSGSSDEKDDIYTTEPGSSYEYRAGTSFAAPVITGIAALLLSVNPNLYNDDIEQIIRLGVKDLGDPGFDTWYGTGRVNAKKALDYLLEPYELLHLTATGGSIYSTEDNFSGYFYGLPGAPDGFYAGKKYEVRKDVTFPTTVDPKVWGRGVATVGYDWSPYVEGANRNFTMGYCEVVPGTLTSDGATLRTWVYEISNLLGQYYDWYPTTPSNVTSAYSVLRPPPENLTLENMSIDDIQVYVATISITAGPAFTVESTGDVTFKAGSVITLKPGFHAVAGSDFHAYIDTSLGGGGLPKAAANVVAAGGENGTQAADDDEAGNEPIPTEFSLSGNYPNPFNPTTTIRFGLPTATSIEFIVYDLLGREVDRLLDRHLDPGYYQVVWRGRDAHGRSLPSGVYIARLVTPEYTKSIKMVLMK